MKRKHILFQPFHLNPDLVEGIYAGCRQFDLRLSIDHPGMLLHEQTFDGLLSNSLTYLDAVRAHGGKAVCYSMLIPSSRQAQFDATVACDESAIGRLGAEYFLRKGYRHFACALDALRKQAFAEALHDAGQEDIRIFPASTSHPGSLAMRANFLRTLPKPCAFLVQTVHFGEFWYEAVKLAGLRVPEDLAVLGIDDIEYICNLLEPSLSSIDTGTFEQGCRMCEVIAKLLNNEPAEPVTLIAPQKRVIERESSDFYAVGYEKLQRMISFARAHIGEGLTVRTLAEKFSLTMPTVYKLFFRHLRLSPKRFLIELQLRHAEKLLKRGNMKMSDIAEESGFATLKSFYDFFHKYHNTTPKEWCYRIR